MAAKHSDMRRATEFDARVGLRLKRRRTTLGMTQEQLAELLGVSWQQLQKYEAGTNRISAARLATIADVLRADIAWFLQPTNDADDASAEPNSLPTQDTRCAPSKTEIAEVLQVFNALSPSDRRRAVALLRTLAEVAG